MSVMGKKLPHHRNAVHSSENVYYSQPQNHVASGRTVKVLIRHINSYVHIVCQWTRLSFSYIMEVQRV